MGDNIHSPRSVWKNTSYFSSDVLGCFSSRSEEKSVGWFPKLVDFFLAEMERWKCEMKTPTVATYPLDWITTLKIYTWETPLPSLWEGINVYSWYTWLPVSHAQKGLRVCVYIWAAVLEEGLIVGADWAVKGPCWMYHPPGCEGQMTSHYLLSSHWLECLDAWPPAILDLKLISVCLTSELWPQSGLILSWYYSHLLGQKLIQYRLHVFHSAVDGVCIDFCCIRSKVKYCTSTTASFSPPPLHSLSFLLDPALMCSGFSFFCPHLIDLKCGGLDSKPLYFNDFS